MHLHYLGWIVQTGLLCRLHCSAACGWWRHNQPGLRLTQGHHCPALWLVNTMGTRHSYRLMLCVGVSTAGWRIWTSVFTFPQLLCHLEYLHLDPHHHHDLFPSAGQCGHLPGQCQAHYLQGGWGEEHCWEYPHTSLFNR